MTHLDSIFKSRDITLPTMVLLVKAMVFPVVMYECESWTVKKAEHQRIDAPLDCKEIQPVHSEGVQPWDIFGRNDAKAETPESQPCSCSVRRAGGGSEPGGGSESFSFVPGDSFYRKRPR